MSIYQDISNSVKCRWNADEKRLTSLKFIKWALHWKNKIKSEVGMVCYAEKAFYKNNKKKQQKKKKNNQ